MALGSAAESRFGILIEGRNQSKAAFDEATRSNQQLTAAVERLIAVSQQQARETHYINDALRGAAEEAKRMREESERLAEEQAKVAAAQRKAAEEAKKLEEAQRAARENMIEWSVAAFATGAALVTASNHAGEFQEKVDLIAEGTGFAAREIGALMVGASNVGRTFEQIAPSIDIFVRRLAEARRGVPEAVQAFGAAGVTNLNQPNGAILQQVGAGLSSIQDPAERSARAFDLFGRSFRAMTQIISQDLKSLADESVSSGLIFEGAMQDVARAADSNTDRMKNAFQGLTNQISVGLAQTGGNALQSFFAEAVEGFGALLKLINESDAALGKFQVGMQSGRFTARFIPGTIASQGFYGDAYTRYSADFPGVGTNLGPDGKPLAYGPMQAQSAVAAAAQAAADSAKAQKEAAEAAEKAAKRANEMWTKLVDSISDPQAKLRGSSAADALERGARAGGGPTADFSPGALEAFRRQEEGEKKRREQLAQQQEQVVKNLMNSIGNSFASFVSSAILGIGTLKQAFRSLVMSVMDQIIQTGVKSLLASIGFPGFQAGGIPHAANGMIISGMRGQDTTLAAVGYGEAIVDHSTTDGLRRLVPKLDEFISLGGGAMQSAGAPVVFNATVNIQGGLTDPDTLRETAERLVSQLRYVTRYQRYRRAA